MSAQANSISESDDERCTALQEDFEARRNDFDSNDDGSRKLLSNTNLTGTAALLKKHLRTLNNMAKYDAWRQQKDQERLRAHPPQPREVYINSLAQTDFNNSQARDELYVLFNAPNAPYISIGKYQGHIYRLKPCTAHLYVDAEDIDWDDARQLSDELILEVNFTSPARSSTDHTDIDEPSSEGFVFTQLGSISSLPIISFAANQAKGEKEIGMEWEDTSYIPLSQIINARASSICLLYNFHRFDNYTGKPYVIHKGTRTGATNMAIRFAELRYGLRKVLETSRQVRSGQWTSGWSCATEESWP